MRRAMLDELHLRKIDGQSTARELAYARQLGKRVRFLEEPSA